MNKRILRVLIHLVGFLPIILLFFQWQMYGLTANPIQEITKSLGRAAILMLFFSLAGTPVYLLTGLRFPVAHRRTYGLYAFSYAISHLIFFVGIDYGMNFLLIKQEVIQKPYILLGSTALLILLLLTLTSFKSSMRLMGKYWKPLHRLSYLAGAASVIHYGMAVKGNLLALSGDILKPLLFGLAYIVLMVPRIPTINCWLREHLLARSRGRVIPKDPLPNVDD